jgi:hypothetical protein
MKNGLVLQGNMEYGIYPEPSFSGFEAIKIILKFTEKTVGSGLLSLRFMPSYPGFLRCVERDRRGCWLVLTEIFALIISEKGIYFN